MAIKINGQLIEADKVAHVGKLLHILVDLSKCELQLQRADKCEVELAVDICRCTVAESYVKARYGKPKQRALVLRVDSRKEKAEEIVPIQKVVKPAVTKFFEGDPDLSTNYKDEIAEHVAEKSEPKKSKPKKQLKVAKKKPKPKKKDK